jgi:hypothetical protein
MQPPPKLASVGAAWFRRVREDTPQRTYPQELLRPILETKPDVGAQIMGPKRPLVHSQVPPTHSPSKHTSLSPKAQQS